MKGRVVSGGFVGRSGELAALQRAGEEAADARPRVMLVGGEAGIGKTRLVEETVQRARASGSHVLWGGCIGLGGLPYGPVAEALRSLVRDLDDESLASLLGPHAGDLARILPALEGRVTLSAVPVAATPEAMQPRLFDAVLGVLDRLAAEKAVVWVAEDLHWADPSTLDLLAFLARNSRNSRVLLVLTYRSDELHRRHPLVPWLTEVGRIPGTERIELERLDRQEIEELVSVLRGTAPDAAEIDTVASRSGGVPLFVEELVSASEHTPLERVPVTLRDLILARVERVASATRQVLQAAAVGGLRVDHALVAAALGQEEAAVEDALGEAMEHQLLAYAPGSRDAVEFRHPLIREALYDDILPGRRRRLHAAYAAALQAMGDPPDADAPAWWSQLADHGDAANDQRVAFQAAVRAADTSSQVGAYGDAARRYERALDLWDVVSDPDELAAADRAELLHRAATATWHAGDEMRAAALLKEAAAALDRTADPLRACRVLVGLSWAMRSQCGDLEASLPIAREALELAPAQPPTVERAMALSELGGLLIHLYKWEESVVACEEAVAVARAVGDVNLEMLAISGLANGLAALGRVDEALEVAVRVREVSLERREPLTLKAQANLWFVFLSVRDLAGMARNAAEVAGLSRDLGLWRWTGIPALLEVVESHWWTGRWPEARALMQELPERDCTDEMRATLRHQACALIDIGQGRFDEAGPHLAHVAVSEWELVWLARALLAALSGADEEALEHVSEGLRRCDPAKSSGGRGDVALVGLRVLAHQAVTARSRGDEVAATTAGRMAAPLLDVVHETSGLPRVPAGTDTWRVAQVAAADGEITRLEGRPDPQTWIVAAERMAALGRKPEVAYLRLRQAEAYLHDGGSRKDARGPLLEAAGLAAGMGAQPLLGEIRGLGRRARIELPDGDRSQGQSVLGPGQVEALTAREREVLALIAQGRTNRQIAELLFISESTAGVHVSHILGKLGAAGRAEAAAAAVRLGLAGEWATRPGG
jgi:DNA-binding CsgD family transcriptional regulator/tetratricopeptide (TPR) repeat protein